MMWMMLITFITLMLILILIMVVVNTEVMVYDVRVDYEDDYNDYRGGDDDDEKAILIAMAMMIMIVKVFTRRSCLLQARHVGIVGGHIVFNDGQQVALWKQINEQGDCGKSLKCM